MPVAPSISCKAITAEDKRHTVYAVTVDEGSCMQKTFSEFERLFEKVKDLLPASLPPPPKRRMLQSEVKVVEKRRMWIESFCVELLSNHPKNEHVQEFFALVSGDQDESHVDLGPSEVKTTKPSDFDFIKTVGKGSFGRVFVVRHKGDKKIYAMKVLQKEYIRKKNEVKHVMAERNVLKANVNHPFLVNLHYSFQTKDKLYFVLDYLQGGELFSHLQREKRFSESRSRFYAADIASALGYLHEHNIIYRDLKPENLLLDRHGYIVLTDFGLCKENIKAKDTTDTFCGTPEYLAPEIILKKPYDRTVDWWCLGSVLFEMLFGLPPFYSKDHNEMYEKIVNQPLRMRHSISAASTDIIIGLLQKDRLKRLGAKRDFQDIKEHPFFMPIDWDKLLKRQVKAPYIPKIKDDSDVTNFDVTFTNEKINPSSLIPNTLAQTQADEFRNFTFVQTHIQT